MRWRRRWRDNERISLDMSEELIGTCALGAIQYQSSYMDELEDNTELYAENIQDIQALLNRTLINWLTALGIMTLSEWLN